MVGEGNVGGFVCYGCGKKNVYCSWMYSFRC